MQRTKVVVSRRWVEDKIETKIIENREGIFIQMDADKFKEVLKKELANMGKVAAIMKQSTLESRLDKAWDICIREMKETTAKS
jgi:hypothetical protein